MPLTPQITLTATLDDYSGAALGSTASPAYLRIALCGYGNALPRIAGTAMVAKVASWPADIPYTGTALSIPLWGNDVITPDGTYYAISVLDAGRNVIQSASYKLIGTGSFDLSSLTPYFPPPPTPPTITGTVVTVPFSATPTFNCATVRNWIIEFEITLTGNVVSSMVTNASAGQIVVFAIIQNSAGGYTFTWPTLVKNPTVINAAANSRTVQPFYVGANGNLYPLSAGTYN